jgi:hypothetical protein
MDNSAKIHRVSGTLALPGKVSPCPPVDPAPDEPPSAPAAPTASCAVEPDAKAKRFALVAEGGEGRFQTVHLQSRIPAEPTQGCSITLRAESVVNGALGLAWFSERKRCEAEATVKLRESDAAVGVEGLGVRSKPLLALKDPKQVVSLQLPLDVEQTALLEYIAPLERVVLFESALAVGEVARRGTDEGLETLSFIPAAPITFTHRIGFNTVWEATCEATPGAWVRLEADEPSAVTLRRVELTAGGLELSFGVERNWTLETGTCSLSNKALEWKALVLTLLAVLVAFGAFKRLLDWLLQ